MDPARLVQKPAAELRGTEMKSHWQKCAGLLGVALLLAGFAPQCAAADDDPPSRVARLSYTKGEVSFEPAGTDDWASAVANRPITTGDKLWTDREARAELHIGSATIRLKGETGFSFLNLTDQIVQIRLTVGTVNVRLQRLEEDETFEVDTPNLAFSLLRAGEYRIEVNEAGDATIVTVRGGEGEVTGGGQAYTVHANQHATFTGTDQLTSDFEEARGYDDFDEWCRERDRRENSAQSTKYVSRDVIGYEDLDEHGVWEPAPDYGYVWVPRTVVVGWAPYRYGHWVWIWPWGWTWVDDAPWGFAPFHYGRWVVLRSRWCWVPGPLVARPVYAPALVAWVGGPRFGVALAAGHVGGGVAWFPLGPREVYVPPYAVSRRYVTNVNVTNTTVNNVYVTNVYNNYTTNNVTNIRYVNRSAPGAVTATSQQTFTSAQAVHRNLIAVNEREVASAQVRGAVGITPEQRSVLGAGAGQRNVARPSETIETRSVVARRAPPPRPVLFTTQRKAIQENEGHPLSSDQVRGMRPATDQQAVRPNVRVAPPAQNRIPVETISRPRTGQPVPTGRPPVTREEPGQPQTGKPLPAEKPIPQAPPERERVREDRPPSAQRPPAPAQTPPSRTPERGEDRPTTGRAGERPPNANNEPADRAPRNPQQVEREERNRQKFGEQRQRLEQKHGQEREGLRQRQERENQKLEQKEQRQQQNEQTQERKTQEKPKPQPQEKPPSPDRRN
jgi:hypothetical protein